MKARHIVFSGYDYQNEDMYAVVIMRTGTEYVVGGYLINQGGSQ